MGFAILYLAIFIAGLVIILYTKRTKTGRKLFNLALNVYIASRGNLKLARRMIRSYTAGMSQAGAISVETIIYIFVAVIIIYQLLPNLGGQNVAVQASTNISAMGKFAAGLGEWLFPLFGILALIFMLWKAHKKGQEA